MRILEEPSAKKRCTRPATHHRRRNEAVPRESVTSGVADGLRIGRPRDIDVPLLLPLPPNLIQVPPQLIPKHKGRPGNPHEAELFPLLDAQVEPVFHGHDQSL